MKKIALSLLIALPAYAQDPAASEAPADSSAPAEQPAADTGAVMDSIATDAAAESAAQAPAEAPPAEPEEVATIPVDEPAPAGDPLRVYVGGDWVRNTFSASRVNGFAPANYDTGMIRLRGGVRPFDNIAIEAQVGFNNSQGDNSPSADTDGYYGLFAVPNAVLFDTVELAFPVGYTMYKVSQKSGADASLNSVSFGLNAELPLRAFTPDLPDFRFALGWMIYHQKVDSRIYGLNAGVRYDFNLNAGNPFAGFGDKIGGVGSSIGGFFKGLWPFGKDEEAPPAQ